MIARRLDIGIFLVSFAVLLVELLLTRIFSVTLYYHLSFMVVSLAMLGFGASGLLVSLRPQTFSLARAPSQLAAAAIALGVTAVLGVGVCLRVSLPLGMTTTEFDWQRVALLFVLCAVPFFAGGVVVSLLLGHHPARAHRLYGADLAGAAAGCVAFVPATDWLGAPSAVLLAGVIACVGGAVLAGVEAPGWRRAAVASAIGLFAVLAANVQLGFYDARSVKGGEQPATLALEWNAFSRVDVPGTPETLWQQRKPFFAGFSARLDPEARVQEAWLRYDADAATQITRFNGDLGRLAYLEYDVSAAAFKMKPPQRVLVLGSGGGRDVLTALRFGAKSVTGVEINPITVRLMKTRFRTFSGGLYDGYPGVNVVNDDARAFLAHDDGRYDVIEASLVDTWAASAAGAYALTENNLYTVEAFVEYLSHLNPDGVAAFNRWFDPNAEPLRVVSLAAAALRRIGVDGAGSRIMVLHTDSAETKMISLASILVKRAPFSPEEIDRLRSWADEMGFKIAYAPDDGARGVPENAFHKLLGVRPSQLLAVYPYDLSAVTDERPFFFSRVPLLSWVGHRLGLGSGPLGKTPLDLGGGTLAVAIATSAAFTLVLVLFARRFRSAATSSGERSGSSQWAIYFGALGLGYILVEVVLIQRLGLFLGRPAFSLSVVLFAMLLSSGLGSFVAGERDARWLSRVLATIGVLLVVYAVGLAAALDALRGTSLPVRVVVAIAVVAPVGFLMGMPFPSGLRVASSRAPSLVPWAWAVNGGASVLGSTLAIVVAMSGGFTFVLLLGGVAYAIAAAAWARLAVAEETAA